MRRSRSRPERRPGQWARDNHLSCENARLLEPPDAFMFTTMNCGASSIGVGRIYIGTGSVLLKSKISGQYCPDPVLSSVLCEPNSVNENCQEENRWTSCRRRVRAAAPRTSRHIRSISPSIRGVANYTNVRTVTGCFQRRSTRFLRASQRP